MPGSATLTGRHSGYTRAGNRVATMEVLATGGTGFLGSELCRELDDRGHEVTALARNPDDADLPAGVRAATGDVTEYETIAEVIDGHDAVVNLVALSPLFEPRGGNRMHDIVHLGGTQNCVRAAESGGVERFVQLSGIHADPNGPTAYLRAKGRAESVVLDASLESTIIRPTAVFGQGGEFLPFIKKVAPPYLTPLPGGGRTRFQPIARDDFIPMLADAVESDEHRGATYEIGGPEIYTLAEIAKMLHRADGRASTVVPIPMPLAGLGMTLGSVIPGFPFGTDQYRSLKLDLVVAENDVKRFGRSVDELMTLTAYLGLDT